MRHIVFFHFLILGLAFSCSPGQKSEQPNIVLIYADDLGWRDTGFMGSQYYETPHLDQLAANGLVFRQAYSAAANCQPSRASLLTGNWTVRHGIFTVGNSDRGASKDRRLIPIENTTELDPAFTTLPEVLKANGYATMHAGKWHLSDHPDNHGFDLSLGGSHAGHPNSYYPPYKNVTLPEPSSEYLTDAIMSQLLSVLDTIRDPFFLYYAPYAVHTPIHPVEKLLPKYEKKTSSNGQHNAAYATMIENLDQNIGRLLDKLKSANSWDNTLVIFSSDNGGHFAFTRQYPLRAGKGSYYEGGIRIPLLFYWENKIDAGNSSELVSQLDLFPTILSLASLDNRWPIDGQDLSGLILEGTPIPPRNLYWHFPIYLQAYNAADNETRDSLFRTRPGSVIRSGDWKLHYYFEDQGYELYNLRADISESNNLASIEVGRLDDLKQKLALWYEQVNAPIPTQPNPEYSSD